ncbi:type I polyketide synthase [Anthocerotibacter panamensis]|uniref:type I polyketide synthase n=1 Tax=Anthocerotibacter panamensis TaxID=2857077 RepID=UPI001C403704|nr:type I polyketide synthase [Anthocerotibacter panamensis]
MTNVAERFAHLSPLQRALLKLEEMQGRLAALERTQNEPIAVVGIGCRFPGGVDSPAKFWQVLQEGRDTITEVPTERWDVDAFYDPDLASPVKMNTRWGGFLDQVDQFDPYFFSLSAREAAGMDPQQRLLLEVAWEALEHAGLAPERIAGTKTGVFIGLMTFDFFKLLQDPPARGSTGVANSIVANRLSYFFDLHGPSMVLDTACSSSLVTIDLACQSLRMGSSEIALAGGVNVILSPDATISSSQAGMMSPDGRCKSFDARANGYVRGEGCGIVVLKRLSDAQRDGDHVWALIRGSAVNQDGRTNGLTAPNGLSQQTVIRSALGYAGLRPEQVSYLEAHGTGTPLGDPIEVEALKQVYGQPRSAGRDCLLGSVKTNMGHLESAAGICALIKVVLSLHHQTIPPVVHFQTLNPNISLDGTPFRIATALQPWVTGGERRFAGVSSFGFGGTNAHVVLEEAPVPTVSSASVKRPLHLFTLSARSEKALSTLAMRYLEHLINHPDLEMTDLCHTANIGRTAFLHRLALVAETTQQVQEQLAGFIASGSAPGLQVGRVPDTRPKLVFLFSGQGAQYVGMARELYTTQPTFRQTLDHCGELLTPYLKQPLLEVLFPAAGRSSPLDETAYAQPVLFALEYALAHLWRSWGVVPDAVLGHSLGEYVAACVAGVFSLEDGLRLVAERARLMQALPGGGAMAVVLAPADQVQSAIAAYGPAVTIAALNGPTNTVLSGPQDLLEKILFTLEQAGAYTKSLPVSHAFHNQAVEPVVASLRPLAQSVQSLAPRIPLVSNLTGQLFEPGRGPDADYWCDHLQKPVRFADQIQTLADRGYEVFVEIGPANALAQMGKRCLPKGRGTWLTSLKKEEDNWQTLLSTLQTLYLLGLPLDWNGLDRDYHPRRVALPTYPFERRRCWLEPHEIKSYRHQGDAL